MTRTGSCLCGAVTYEIGGEIGGVLHCHCVNCRRATGNFVAAVGCSTNALAISDPHEQLTWFVLEHCRYGFCRTCGSRMFWQGAEHMDRTSVQTGTLDDASGLELAGVWFAPEAQGHHRVDPDVPHFSENGDSYSG